MSVLSRQVQHFGSSTQLYFKSVYLFHIYAEATRANPVRTITILALCIALSKPILVSHVNLSLKSWIIRFPYPSNLVKSHSSQGLHNQRGHVTMEGDLP